MLLFFPYYKYLAVCPHKIWKKINSINLPPIINTEHIKIVVHERIAKWFQ